VSGLPAHTPSYSARDIEHQDVQVSPKRLFKISAAYLMGDNHHGRKNKVVDALRYLRSQPSAAGRARRRWAHGVRSRSSPQEGFTFRQSPKEFADVGSPGDVVFWNMRVRGIVLESW